MRPDFPSVCANLRHQLAKADDAARSRRKQLLLLSPRRNTGRERIVTWLVAWAHRLCFGRTYAHTEYRAYAQWPKIGQATEDFVQHCQQYQENQHSDPKVLNHFLMNSGMVCT